MGFVTFYTEGEAGRSVPPMLTAETLGAVVRELRALRGLTQLALARRLGISSGQMSQIESGYYVPSLKVIGTILGELDAHLEVELDEGGLVDPSEGGGP